MLLQDGFASGQNVNAVMIVPRDELALSATTVNQRRCLKCTYQPRLPGHLNLQLRPHKDSKSHAMGTVFGSCPLVCLGRGNLTHSSPLSVYKVC
jgi:hypothetical protein